MDKPEYLADAAETGGWEPVCPLCNTETSAIELDYNGIQWCESYANTFNVEGM